MSVRARHRKPQACTGAILAGGKSSRMGRPKQDVVLADGRTMIEHVHDALAPLCDQIVILGECASLPGFQRVRDLRADAGPLGGIEALLASGMDQQYLVVPCDVPRITSGLLSQLLADEKTTLATVFADHPLPARLSAEALPTVTRLLDQEHRAVWRLMDALKASRVAVPAGDEAMLQNVNQPDDLHRI